MLLALQCCAAIRDRDQAIERHIHDSLALLPVVDQLASDQDRQSVRVIDVGTGGGFPGVVLAIARPGWQVLIAIRNLLHLIVSGKLLLLWTLLHEDALAWQPSAGAGQHALLQGNLQNRIDVFKATMQAEVLKSSQWHCGASVDSVCQSARCAVQSHCESRLRPNRLQGWLCNLPQ